MDVYHHQLNGKILSTSNDKYIILSKDQNNKTKDEINSSSSSSSSPTGNNNPNLITKYQLNKHHTSQYQTQFFQNDHEYKKVLGSTTTFNYRNVTPSNEYYL
jgi:hypothetical protein